MNTATPEDVQNQLLQYIDRRRASRTRRMRVLVVVGFLGLVVGFLGIGRLYRHWTAANLLSADGWVVDWYIDRSNWTSGGSTNLGLRPNRGLLNRAIDRIDYSSVLELINVESLDLSHTEDLGESDLSSISKLTSLKELILDRSFAMKRAGGAAFAQAGGTQVRPFRKLSDRALEHLRPLVNLERLYLSGHGVTDAGVARLAVIVPGLTELDIEETPVTDKAIEHLAKMKRLRLVRVAGSKITSEASSELQRMRPDLVVESVFLVPSRKSVNE